MNYADLLISQYARKSRARATIEELENDMKRSFNGALSVAGMLNIDSAVGYSLDIIGKIVGQSRILTGAVAREFFAFLDKSPTQGFQRQASGGSPWYRHGDAIASTATLTDSEYRAVIRARCIKNFSRCTLDSVEQACEKLFGRNRYSVGIIGPCHWEITTTDADPFILFCAKELDVLPRSSGMLYTFVESEVKNGNG
ncbi:DUF2612 domain-containing protein [Enterobacter cancerogenus]